MEGKITVTNKEGHIIFSTRIWTALLFNTFSGMYTLNEKEIRVFIDGVEISKPKAFQEDT